MTQTVGGMNWCPTPPRSPEREASPREEVLQAPASFQPAPAHHGPLTHLWTPSAYVDLVSDGDDDDTDDSMKLMLANTNGSCVVLQSRTSDRNLQQNPDVVLCCQQDVNDVAMKLSAL
ncbi:hypothetical protein D1007_03987 [Hordeum vulgare]|nr:hypothetical protein D1007_03987 [Hordeum vulgare]